MPRLDKSGPRGLGPQTGRGLGYCPAGYGFARGWGFPYWRNPSEETKALKEEIKEIEKRLEELKKEK